jgi:hypothetical protein
VTYFLVVFMVGPGAAAATQIGPFGDLLACEKAAGQVMVVAPHRPNLKYSTVCINTRSYHLVIPKEKGKQ